MILLDVHTHSISSGHGTTCTIADMAKAAHKKGLSLLGISDHGPGTPGACTASYFRSLQNAPRTRCGVQLLYGVECNILDNTGSLDLDSHTLKHLDYAIASMHLPTIKPGSIQENTQAYIHAMKNPYINIIGHCDDTRYPVDYKELSKAAADYGVMIELNNASLLPNGYRGNTIPNCIHLLYWCSHYQVPIVLSSDSHGAKNVGNVQQIQKLLHIIEEYPDFGPLHIVNYDVDAFMGLIQHKNLPKNSQKR